MTKKSEGQEFPPAYTEVQEQDPLLQPVLGQPQPVPYPYTNIHIDSINVPPLQVVTASTSTPVPIRLVDGRIYLTVLEPVKMYCPHCRATVKTVLDDQATCCAYASCMFLFYVCTPLCFVPFCIKDCRQQVHNCSQCGATLAHITTIE
jgi:hypothetical protein